MLHKNEKSELQHTELNAEDIKHFERLRSFKIDFFTFYNVGKFYVIEIPRLVS